MILTQSSGSERMTREHVEKLAQCDYIYTFGECGWFNIYGSLNGTRLVNCFATNEEEAHGIIVGAGYSWDGDQVRKISQENPADRLATVITSPRNSWGGFGSFY